MQDTQAKKGRNGLFPTQFVKPRENDKRVLPLYQE